MSEDIQKDLTFEQAMARLEEITGNMESGKLTLDESIAAFEKSFTRAAEEGIQVIGTVQMAFGSPWDGEIPVEKILSIVEIYRQYGIRKVGLGDTALLAHQAGLREPQHGELQVPRPRALLDVAEYELLVLTGELTGNGIPYRLDPSHLDWRRMLSEIAAVV